MQYVLSCFFGLMMLAAVTTVKEIDGSESVKGIDIIPTPKLMELTGKRFVLTHNGRPEAMIIIDENNRKAALAAQEINNFINALGGQPLPIGTDVNNGAGRSRSINTIQLVSPQKTPSGDFPSVVREAMDILSTKGEQGYAIRFYSGQKEGEAAVLAGIGWQGLLNASSTFCLLIKKEGATIFMTEAQVTDWPDFKYRGLPVWPLPGSFDDFKKYVDWAFRYKFNRIYTYTTRQKAPDGFNLPSSEERRYLRKINAYARDRGIKINYELTWAVAQVSQGESRDEHQGSVLINDQYYSWSDDASLRKRASEIAQFAHETEAESLLFHCIDTYEEGWDKRGKNDHKRFGKDRASADANVINIFTREIRKSNPGIELQFVVAPYHANFDLLGNERYKTWIARLTALIPNDVYLTVAELNREQTDSWIAVARQPLVHWINGYAFQWGRYFSILPAFDKTAFYEGRDRDIIIHWEPIGYFNGEVMQLIAAEYSWNVDAPGSGQITEERAGKIMVGGADLHYRKEMINGMDAGAWAWYRGTGEPEPALGNLLLKACRLEFGEEAAPYMVEFFRNNPIGWRNAGLYNQVLHDVMPGKELDACSDQLKKTKDALSSLKKALTVIRMNSPVRERLKRFLSNTYNQALVINGMTAYYQAKQLLAKGLNAEASEVIINVRNQIAAIRRKMEKTGYWSDESQVWHEESENSLKIAEAGIHKVLSRNLLKNPGFEEPLGPIDHNNKTIPWWSSFGSLEITQDSHSGRYAAKLKLKSSDDFVLMEQALAVVPGCNGYVEFWLKKDDNFRVIPVLQYWNADHTKKIEDLAVNDFPFNTAVQDYGMYSGTFLLPPHVTRAVFKIYADWFGFTPNQEKMLYLDDVFVSCGSN
ncbi:MAG TPA: hypothetical protein VL122_03935 [Nitrospirota bacterium]|nr:hypothetical protein [Nitrospirota bacterium]